MRVEAAVALQTEVEGELLVDTSSGGKVAVGKRRGLNILTELAELRSKVSGLEKFREEVTSQIDSIESRIQSLSNRCPSTGSCALVSYRHTSGMC